MQLSDNVKDSLSLYTNAQSFFFVVVVDVLCTRIKQLDLVLLSTHISEYELLNIFVYSYPSIPIRSGKKDSSQFIQLSIHSSMTMLYKFFILLRTRKKRDIYSHRRHKFPHS